MENGFKNFSHQESSYKFGAFLGVFTPSVLTILGVIMYLRFGWVVAQTGLLYTVLIVIICSSIALLTALSASAVATNSRLGMGGEYFLISRSLGLTIGGAIGIPLFLCYILSITLYCFGLAEFLTTFWPAAWGTPPVQWIAGALVVLIIAISGKSAKAALRLQIPLMILVGLSILALALGVFTGPLRELQWMPPPGGIQTKGEFWIILAVFFPAVTGFSAGIGMSGDLKDPQKAIPRGTISAVLVGTAVYMLIPFLLAITGKVSVERMANISLDKPPVWTNIALFGGILIYPGLCGAILSSAFGSSLAGPRILQALAKDKLAPSFLARTSKTGQPTIATWVSGAIALSAVALGSLNMVAKFVTILFLTLYLSENFVAAVENIVRDPSYRPTLKIHWSISLLGVIGILLVMFLISIPWSLIAICFELTIWLYLRRKNLAASWGDIWEGLWGTLARFSLYKLARQKKDVRSWRPNILLFADQLQKRAGQIRMSALFNQNCGILTVCDVITGSQNDNIQTIADRNESMKQFFDRERIVAFGEADIMEDFESGVLSIVQAHGMGALRPNTIAFGWPSRQEQLVSLLRLIRKISQLEKAILIIRPKPPEGPRNFERIDIWWRGKYNNGDLMLLLAYLLTLNPSWRSATIYLRSIIKGETARLDMENGLKNLIEATRIKAEQDVIVLDEEKSVIETMHERSKGADVVFVGLMSPVEGTEEEYSQRLREIIDGFPTTVLVHNSGPFRGQLLEQSTSAQEQEVINEQ
ncbi:MAG: amino acid permease [Planctomycetota bacterium]|jgi:amino acid transporter